MKETLLLIYILLCFESLFSQNNDIRDGERHLLIIEEFMNDVEDQAVVSELYEYLVELQENPLNLNTANNEELEKLFLLNKYQIFALLDHREIYGELYSLGELIVIPGFDKTLIRKISPFVRIEPPELERINTNRIQHNLRLKTTISSPLKSGFSDSLYEENFTGKNFYKLIKYELKKRGKFRAGITMESDPGEKIRFDSLNKGFDFLSGFAEIHIHEKSRTRIIIGDYRVSKGLGLVCGRFGNRKSSATIINHGLTGNSPYTSSSEYGYKRGLSLTFNPGRFRSELFYSGKNLSAKTAKLDDSRLVIKEIIKSGLHRNINELINKKQQKEVNYGISLGYDGPVFGLNYHFLNYTYGNPLRYKKTTDRFSGYNYSEKFSYHSADYSVRAENFLFRGEIATNTDGLAFLTMLTTSLHPLFQISLSYRDFDPHYHAPESNAFAESSTVRNEKGFYFGMEAFPFPFMKLNMYLDLYRFPWLRYYSPSPYHGRDILFRAEANLESKLLFDLLYKSEHTFGTEPSVKNSIREMKCEQSERYMLQVLYEVSNQINLKSRIEIKTHKTEGVETLKTGIFLSQDIKYRFARDKFSLNMRYAVFDIPDWENRIYVYENDVLYHFSTPLHYKSGIRFYLTGMIKFFKKNRIYLKYSRTAYTGLHSSGTGVDQREGTNYDDLRIQMILKI